MMRRNYFNLVKWVRVVGLCFVSFPYWIIDGMRKSDIAQKKENVDDVSDTVGEDNRKSVSIPSVLVAFFDTEF